MMKYLLIAMLIISSPAFAQDATPSPVPAPVHVAPSPVSTTQLPPPAPSNPPVMVPTKWVLELDQADLNFLNQAIGEMKYRDAMPFIEKLKANLRTVK